MPLTTIYDGGTRVIGNTSTPLITDVLHPSTRAYMNAQNSVGYIMSKTEIEAINNLVLSLVGTGLWTKMQVIYPCIGNSTIGANAFKWNLKDITAFTITFQGSWTFASTGMQIATAATANRGTTGYIPSTHATLGDAHISAYVRNFYTAGINGALFGSYSSSQGGGTMIGVSYSQANTADGYAINPGINSGRISLSGYSGGMLTASRLTSAGFSVNSLNANIVTNALALTTGTRNPQQMWIGNAQVVGGVTAQPQEIAFGTIGLGLTSIDIRNLYVIVQAFQTALGRQV